MKKYFAVYLAARIFQTTLLFLLAAALFLTCASPAAAQKEKKIDMQTTNLKKVRKRLCARAGAALAAI